MKNYAVLEKDKKLINNHMAVVLEEAFNKGYAQGYGDCKVELTAEESNVFFKEGYDQGLQHSQELKVKAVNCAETCGMQRAWNAARKIVDLYSELTQEELGEIFGSFDVNDILNGLSASEAVAKLETWEKEQEQTEKSCATCGQPRDYKGICIPYKEGKCNKLYKAWTPKQDATESNGDTIEVGDEIKVVKNTCKYGEIGVVTFVRENSIDALTTRGYIGTRTGNVVKTGRRFAIQAILDEMKSYEEEQEND